MEARIETLEARVLQLEKTVDTLKARVLQVEKNGRKRKVDDSRSADVKIQAMMPNIGQHPRDQTMDRLYIERGTTNDYSIRLGTPEQASTFFATAQLGSTMEVDFSHMSWDYVVLQLDEMFKSVKGNFQISGGHRMAVKRLAISLNLHAVPESGTFPGVTRAYFTSSEGRALWNVNLERKSQMQEKFRGHYSGLELIVVFNGKFE